MASKSTENALIELQHVSLQFGTDEVLSDVCLTLDKASRTAVMGRSGVGKTTLVRLIAGLLPATTGKVLFAGNTVRGPSERVTLVFQRGGCFPWLTSWGNVMFPLKCLGWHTDPVRRERAEELLREVGLTDAMHKHPHEMSGGMVQRLMMARAIAAEPEVLIIDEPFSALDPITRAEMRDLLTKLCDEHQLTLVLVTHDPTDAEALTSQVVLLAGQPATSRSIHFNDLSADKPLLEHVAGFF